jgi:hypothetical protein
MKVNVHIERVIVDGVAVTAAHADRIREALQSEMMRLIMTRHVPEAWQSSADVYRVNAPAIQLSHDEVEPSRLGEQIAGAVLGREAK